MWAIYALIAALLTSFLPIINKRMLLHAPVAVVAWVPNALSLPLLLTVTLALLGWPQVDGVFFVGILASGLLNLVATLASTRADARAIRRIPVLGGVPPARIEPRVLGRITMPDVETNRVAYSRSNSFGWPVGFAIEESLLHSPGIC